MSTDVKPLILASSSPRRQELIRSLGLPYRIMVSEADESTEPHWSPARIVEELAARKARTVCARCTAEGLQEASVVIGSDTIVVLDGAVLGKPEDAEDAYRMLKALQGRRHQVFSGVACFEVPAGGEARQAEIDARLNAAEAIRLGELGHYRLAPATTGGTATAAVGHTASQVTFRPMSDAEIRAYIGTGDPLDKAGSYGIQGLGSLFIERIEGDFYSIMGLPMNLLYQMLQRFGISPFASESKASGQQ